MARRIIHDTDYMNYIMTPPVQEEYTKNDIKVDTVRVFSKDRCTGGGLGEVSLVGSGGSDQQSWVMPVVIIVVSAMALMTLYAVLSKR
jgi:hypothetical protein